MRAVSPTCLPDSGSLQDHRLGPNVGLRGDQVGGTGRAKMESLFFLSPSSIRRDGVCYSYDDSGTENVWIISTFEVLPPTDRLGGLYSDEKLNVVLPDMHNNVQLPPMKLRLI